MRDLFGQPILYGVACFVDQRLAGAADFVDVLGHYAGDGVALGGLLQGGADPGAFGPGEDGFVLRFVWGQGAIVEVGGVLDVAGVGGGVELDVEHALGDDAAGAGAG